MSTLSDHNTELVRIKEYNTKTSVFNNRDPDRYYLEEYFKRLPDTNSILGTVFTNADATDAANTAIRVAELVANKDFELIGEHHTDGTVEFSSTIAGFNITTAGADNDQMIIQPHADTNQSAWNNLRWATQDEVIWECALYTSGSIVTMAFWAGLKTSTVGTYATDDNKAYFLFSTNDDIGALTTNANLHFVYSVSGTDYITDLGIAVAANTIYKLKIVIDSDRRVSVYVNGKVYGLVTTDLAGGTTQTNTGQKSLVLTTGIALKPYIGLQTLAGVTSNITVCYQKISRTIV